MTNLRLQNLENHFLTLRNQKQNNFNSQVPVHMMPPQHVFHVTSPPAPNQWIQQVPSHPLFRHGIPAPPPYMYRKSDRIPEVPRQIQRPNINLQFQQAQMFNPSPSELVTQLPTSDSNNCIAVNQGASQQSLFNQLFRTQEKVLNNLTSIKGFVEFDTKFKDAEDVSNTLTNDSKNIFAVREDLKLKAADDISNTRSRDSKNSFAVREENVIEKTPISSIQDRHSTDSSVSYNLHQNLKFNSSIDSSVSAILNSKNCFVVKRIKESKYSSTKAKSPYSQCSKKWKLFFRQRTNHSSRSRYSAPCEKNDITVGKASPLRILSFNIKGFNSNKNYLNELLDKHDIILLQERWLFNYEKELLKQHH
ncbi:unnamed protein product [Mytilus coruscus]|uniref:Endonuclease/exonuclease/phosphatase domain-containing protein n=1 Tax=Mytilus coruscus TaxID=42192 RepID=A0A6J8DJG7_MYTCO|nr:unnamed protein product [Mytilus coruscus]